MTAIAAETEKQIQTVLSTGLPIRHLDGHHHSHLRPELFITIAALTAKYKIPYIRYFADFYEGLYPGYAPQWIPGVLEQFGLKFIDRFFAGWEPVESSLPGYKYYAPEQPFEVAELMVHPGVGEAWRERELALCTSPDKRHQLKDLNITLTNFAELSAEAVS
jgi:predicted glycoside hydrolase/deacetylase ChbG (UPF0249 family)